MVNSKDRMLEVGLTPIELRAVIKSLSIGVDQLAKKCRRLSGTGASRQYDDTQEEVALLISAKQEMEDVLCAFLMADDEEDYE